MTTLDEGQPYPGLRSFRRDETHIFFGREATINDMVDRLAESRFLAVTGASGSGKSSLVRTGLLDALDRGLLTKGGTEWRIADFRPGARPFAALAVALGEATGAVHSAHEQLLVQARLARGPLGLVEWLDEIRFPSEANLLLLVDQFEEIFRFRHGEAGDDIDAFVALLLASTRQRQRRIYVIITMRSDFLGDCAQFNDLAETINDGQFLTPRLTREQCQQAIEGPAKVFGGRVEKALVTRLLNDMGSNADQLPLMQHVLMLLWQRAVRHGGVEPPTLTLKDYEALGGLGSASNRAAGAAIGEVADAEGPAQGALSRHADEIFAELTPRQQQLARTMFRALTESEGTSGRDVRRPTDLGTIAAIAGVPPAEIIPVIEAFRAPGRNFLTPPRPIPLAPDSTIDISHESLIRQWSKLREWAREEFNSAEQYRHLERTARLWKTGSAEPIRQPYLGVALAWREREHPNPVWAARYGGAFDVAIEFLERSRQEEQRRADRHKLREEEELRHKLRTESAERRIRFVSAALAVAVVALLSIIGLAFLWQHQIQVANTNLKLVLDGARTTVQTVQQAYDRGSINLDLALRFIDETNATANRLPKEQEEPQTRHIHLLLADVLSETYLKIGKTKEALAAAEDEVRLATSLVGINPRDDQWRYDLAKSYFRLGKVRVETGDLIDVSEKSNKLTANLDAQTAYRRFVEIVESLAAKYPDNEQYQKDLSNGYDQLGDVAQSIGNLDDALANYGRRLRVALSNNRSDTYWQWDEAISRLNIGDILLAQGKLDGASEQFQQFEATMVKLVYIDKDKINARWRWNHALGYERLGDVQMKRGNIAAALRDYNRFLGLVAKLVEQDPANSDWQRGLAIANERLGDAQLAMADTLANNGDTTSAVTLRGSAQKAYEQDRQIAAALVRKDAANTTFRRDLSIAEEKVGDALFAQARFDDALDRYQEYNSLASALVRDDAANADWQRDLATSYQRIGDALRAKNETRPARDAFQQCSAALSKYGKPVKTYDPRNSHPDDIAQYCRAELDRLQKQLASDTPDRQ